MMNIITLGHFEGSNILGQDVSGKHLYKIRPNYLGTGQTVFDPLPPLSNGHLRHISPQNPSWQAF